MRCDEVRGLIEELGRREVPTAVSEHLASCSACDEYARDWRLVRAGFSALAAEGVPEPSVGFAARLARRGEEALGAQFVERIGRRFVFAMSALTLLVVLGLSLPSSSPLQVLMTPDLGGQAEVATLGNDPLFPEASEGGENVRVAPAGGGDRIER